jgi:DNA-binding response OmpR family regulator
MNPQPKVLVAEDNAALAGVIGFNLERAGYSVAMALNGQDAWDIAGREEIDLVITDENMPLLSGQELCRRLRNDARYIATPIVFLTAKQLEIEHTKLERELGVSITVGKPFSPKELVKTIQQIMPVDPVAYL